jgi:hypothetical protein
MDTRLVQVIVRRDPIWVIQMGSGIRLCVPGNPAGNGGDGMPIIRTARSPVSSSTSRT